MQIAVADPYQRVLAIDGLAREADNTPLELIPNVDLEALNQAIQTVEATLAPAGSETGRSAVEYCLRLLSAKRPDQDVIEGYASILGDLPRDLLGQAVKACLSAATYHKLPPPGQFREKIKQRLEERTDLLLRLKRYRTRLQFLNQRRARLVPSSMEVAVGSKSFVPKPVLRSVT